MFMRKKNPIVLLAVLSAFVMIACQPKGQNSEKPEFVEFTEGLTREDTLAVKGLVTTFMTYVQDGKYGDAAAMLYKADAENAWNEPLQLDNDEVQNVSKMLQTLTVKNFEIAGLTFQSAINNEVVCHIVSRESSADSPAIVRKFYFKPMNYLGGWRLCLKDSSHGDNR